jgi:alkylation response protein AidB-like acyl-CoA dehydrogenase
MAIDFTLTPRQVELRGQAHKTAQTVLGGIAELTRGMVDPDDRWRATQPAFEALIAEGWLRRLLPQPLGGTGGSMVDFALVAEEFMAVDVNVPLTLFATILGLSPLMAAGNPEQLAAHFGRFLELDGAPLAAFAFSEPGGSANYAAPPPAEGVRTTAVLDGDSWVINGRKKWVSSSAGWDGKGPDLLTVLCRTGEHNELSLILVPGPVGGLRLEKSLDLLGVRAHQTPMISLTDVRVPRENLLAVPGAGPEITGRSFLPTAALVGVFALAQMRTAFDLALEFAKSERRAGAVPVIEYQAVGYALADAKGAMEAVRYLAWKACHALDTGAPGAAELSLHSKVFGSETAVRVIIDLMRVVGIESYDRDTKWAGLLEDALIFPLFDGGNLGIRRRQLQGILAADGYDPTATFNCAEATA